MASKKKQPVWLRKGTPEYWEYWGNKAKAEIARLEEANKDKTIKITLPWDDHMLVEECFRIANQFHGTNGQAKALVHICGDYLREGEYVRAMKSAGQRNKKPPTLAELIKEAGPLKTIETFNKVFPVMAIYDFPK